MRHRAMLSLLLSLVISIAGCSLQHYTAAPPDVAGVPTDIALARLDAPSQLALLAQLGVPHDALADPWTPSQIGILAVARDRTVMAARSAILAAAARARLAAQRQNPQLNFALERHSMEEDGSDSLWGVGPSIDLTLVPPAVRRLTGERASFDVAIARLDAIETAWQSRNVAVDAVLALIAIQHQRKHLELADAARNDAVDAARALVAAGITEPFEWQTMMLERNDARLARPPRIAANANARADLAAALTVPVTALDGMSFVPDAARALPDFAELQSRMLASHPAVLRALAEHAQRERDLALAIAAQYPSVQLSPGFFFDQGDHVWSLLGGVIVPLFARHDVAIASAASARDAALDEVYATQARVIVELQRAHARWRGAVAVLAETRIVARDIVRAAQELERKRDDGIADELVLARARLQAVDAALQVEVARGEARRLRELVVANSRLAELAPPFARWLDALMTVVPAVEIPPP